MVWLMRSGCAAAAMALVGSGGQPLWAQAEAFGRWQQRPSHCVVEHGSAPPIRCHGLQLDQRSAEVLRLSVQAEGVARGELVQFTLVGALVDGDAPMGCRQGACSLTRALNLSLSSISTARFDGRGLARTLPETLPVRGACRIDIALVHCEAISTGQVDAAGPAWTLRAELR